MALLVLTLHLLNLTVERIFEIVAALRRRAARHLFGERNRGARRGRLGNGVSEIQNRTQLRTLLSRTLAIHRMEEGEDGWERLGARIARQLRHRVRDLNRKRRQFGCHPRRGQHNLLLPLSLFPLLLLLRLQRIL